MKKIKLTQGKFTIIDSEDYKYLNQFKWQIDKDDYAVRKASRKFGKPRKTFRMAREIMKFPKNKEVDHKNHDKLDNRKTNLRICTHAQNQMNRNLQKNNTSGFSGILWSSQKNKWIAQIHKNNKKIHLGSFKKIESAILTRKNAEKLYYGNFANYGQISVSR